jgi:diguanylate cyclase (GGDEF)-like protein
VAEEKVKEELRLAASRDSLTGILNHKAFFEQGERELRRFVRYGKPFSLIEIDIDDFKNINDSYGHTEGDNVLQKLVSLIGSHVRQSDVFGRTGGDEFCLLLIETHIAEAVEIAERIRITCSECRLNAGTGAPIHFTVSVGLVESSKNDANIGHIYSRADAAMYRAKSEGRNRVCTS